MTLKNTEKTLYTQIILVNDSQGGKASKYVRVEFKVVTEILPNKDNSFFYIFFVR